MRVLLVLVAIAHADTTIPSPAPGASWIERCHDAIARAQTAAAKEEPGFAAGKLEILPKFIGFHVYLADREHARFFAGKPAHFFLEIREKKSKQPGQLGGDSMSPKDPQASAGLTKWTRDRYAGMDVQIAEYKKVEIFNRLFRPAMDECLRP